MGMAVNKVVYGTTTLIDLTEDTVTADKLAAGETAHDAAGELITGTMESSGAAGDYEDFRLINTVNISDPVSQIEFTSDSGGAAFSLKEYFLLFDRSPSAESASNVYVRHNGKSTFQVTRYSLLPVAADTTANIKPWVHGKQIGGEVWSFFFNYNKNQFVNYQPIDSTEKVSSILVLGTTFLSGRVRLYGR